MTIEAAYVERVIVEKPCRKSSGFSPETRCHNPSPVPAKQGGSTGCCARMGRAGVVSLRDGPVAALDRRCTKGEDNLLAVTFTKEARTTHSAQALRYASLVYLLCKSLVCRVLEITRAIGDRDNLQCEGGYIRA